MTVDAQVAGHLAFRAVLEALSRPGIPAVIGGAADARQAAAAVLQGIWDPGTSTALVGDPPTPWAASADLHDAELVIVRGTSSAGALLAARRGTEEYPERGATVLFWLDAEPRPAETTEVVLAGPGVDGRPPCRLPLGRSELEARATACAAWPLGVDVLIVGPGPEVLGLPRTTRVDVA